MSVSKKIAKLLLDIEAITFSPEKPYRYTSGILSPVYSDMRLLMSYPTERKVVISALSKVIESIGIPDILAGTATAGIPHAAFLAQRLDIPMVYVRGKAKEHGKKSQIEGLYKKGMRTIVIEDLISTGGSSLETVTALKRNGGKVKDIVAIYTYTMPQSTENIADANITLHTLTTFPDVVNVAVEEKIMKAQDKDLVLSWLKDPKNWGKKMGFEK